MTVLFIDEMARVKLHRLAALAARQPIDMPALVRSVQTVEGKRAHMRQMDAQTIIVPVGYMVTFSIEIGHPIGTCRHMSVSVEKPDRVPTQQAVWMIARELGFWGEQGDVNAYYPEKLSGRIGLAVNAIQVMERVVH